MNLEVTLGVTGKNQTSNKLGVPQPKLFVIALNLHNDIPGSSVLLFRRGKVAGFRRTSFFVGHLSPNCVFHGNAFIIEHPSNKHM